jgi:CDP-diacylglycerol--serine O-phosphatidyltransferase
MKGKTRRFKVRRRLKEIALLPTLVTLGNIVCGFGAVVCATQGLIAWKMNLAADASFYFEWGAWLVLLAMIFDALDGRVARMTGTASKFGAELDSLCDVVSFGLAPAFLAWCTIEMGGRIIPAKAALAICAVYASCAALRLARFNVETTLDEEAHMSFRGLPSPAAAGVVTSLCLLRSSLAETRFADAIVIAMPFIVLASGLLMISRIRYAHFVNRVLRGQHRFTRLAEVVLVALVVALHPSFAAALGFVGYAVSGPLLWFFRKPLPAGAPAPEPGKPPQP